MYNLVQLQNENVNKLSYLGKYKESRNIQEFTC